MFRTAQTTRSPEEYYIRGDVSRFSTVMFNSTNTHAPLCKSRTGYSGSNLFSN